jgi:TonB family protein
MFSLQNYAQKTIDDAYAVQDIRDGVDCEMTFYKNGCYGLMFREKATFDVLYYTDFSTGTYRFIDNKHIEFVDKSYNFKMLATLVNKKLLFSVGFPFLLAQPFMYAGSGNEYDSLLYRDMIPQEIQKERETYKKNQKALYPFAAGIYESENSNDITMETDCGYEIDFNENGCFKLKYQGLFLLSGTWDRNGNELILSDENLKHSFYMFICKDGLIGKYLPGARKDEVFQKKSKLSEIYTPKKHWMTKLKERGLDGRSISIKEPQGEPFMFVDQMPEFPQGDKALKKYLKNNLRYPDAAKKAGIKGKIYVRFVIERDGSIGTVTIVKSLSPECDEEAIRLVKSMPKWIPGKQNGKEVAVYDVLAVSFE